MDSETYFHTFFNDLPLDRLIFKGNVVYDKNTNK